MMEHEVCDNRKKREEGTQKDAVQNVFYAQLLKI